MHRTSGLLFVVAVLMFGMITAGGFVSGVVAQDATPPADGPPPGGFEIAPGVTAEALAFMEGHEEPSVYRLTFEAGVTYQIEESPALEIAHVESGTLAVTFTEPVTIGQVHSSSEAGETVEPGTEVTLEAGDYVLITPFTGGEAHNDGNGAADVLVANIVPEQDMATPMSNKAGW